MVNESAPEGYTLPAPVIKPAVLLLSDTSPIWNIHVGCTQNVFFHPVYT